jgi:signal transduction histidine kinase/DNA-binding response OmpR family regulator
MQPDERINILVVDDVPEKLIALEAILEDLGRVVCARSGREALRRLLDQDFALILLDVNMPGMDGFETASLIRQRKKSEHTPIIFITGFSDETHVSRGYSLGAVDYILTPVVPEVLRAKVAVFVDLYRKTELVRRQGEQQVAIAREQAARAAAEAATRRSAFLADASTLLAASLDYDATISHAARLPIPTLADVSILRLAGRRREPPQWACSRRDLDGALAADPAGPFGPILTGCAATVARSGKTAVLSSSQLDPLNVDAAVVLPLVARGKVLGTLSLARIRNGATYSLEDVSLAEDLAGRIAMAIDNADLFRKVQDGDRRKDEFLATLGHELRNPLAAISNALQCLELAPVAPVVVEEARAILRRQTAHVVRLVEDLLDVSRITRGKVRLRKEVVEAATIVERAVSNVQTLVADRRQHLSVSLPSEPVHVHGDPTRLEQAVGNLLNNAAKYTPPGGRIGLLVELETDQVAIRVNDTGAGIADELLPKIFDLFAQGDRTLDHSQGGLGIGLTLVRSLVALHGGTVEATSAGLGQGSEFVIRLPVASPETSEAVVAEIASSNGAAGPLPRRRVLLVDDNVDLATTTAALLGTLGHTVRYCHGGAEALRLVDEDQPEVVFVDIGLPEMSGHDVARALRRKPGGEDLVLVAMTGFGQAEDRRRSREAGFDVHLVKPVALDTLADVLKSPSPRRQRREANVIVS